MNWSTSTSCCPLLQAMLRCIMGNLERCSFFTTSLLFLAKCVSVGQFAHFTLHRINSKHNLLLRIRSFLSHSLAFKTHFQSLKLCIKHPDDDPALLFTGSVKGVGVEALLKVSWRAAGVSRRPAETKMRSEED